MQNANVQNHSIFPIDFEGFRPTFKEAVISTAVIEAAGKSLEDSGNWKPVEDLL